MVSEGTVYLPAGAGPHRLTNETLPIGLPQAKFPGTVGRPGASDRRVPIGAAYVFCGISSVLHMQTSAAALPFDWNTAPMRFPL